ncbi:hypothetical protein [Pseudoduganella lutea]|uniref:Uncharacterized protein n=1 Tax=Pseudoduganella lutea TaxID=321985 RepID=A0A4P6L4B8_9BURK|nr:hypothetical protein [Pseudoduganella lutea]QBE66430.1 hypothetical protein EWM63_28540 [Pseudoduganella lutea]
MNNEVLAMIKEQAAQIQMLSEAFHQQTKQQGIYALRDLALLKVLILELEESQPGISASLQKRLDMLILQIGDDPDLCASIHLANQFLVTPTKT